MGPKFDVVCRFVELTGDLAAIGALESAAAVVRGEAGTIITPDDRTRRTTIASGAEQAR
jgi:carbamate kinase